jgi:hypothetical protein
MCETLVSSATLIIRGAYHVWFKFDESYVQCFSKHEWLVKIGISRERYQTIARNKLSFNEICWHVCANLGIFNTISLYNPDRDPETGILLPARLRWWYGDGSVAVFRVS